MNTPGAACPDHAHEEAGARIEEILERQRQLFERLSGLCEAQGRLIDADDSAGLLTLLAQRQRIIDGIAELNSELEPYRARWGPVLAALPDAERERVNQKLGTLSDLAASIAERDGADRSRLEQRRDAVSAELSNVSRGRGAVAAYGPGAAPARFQDREA